MPEFNPLTSAFRDDPYPTLAELRAEAPVGEIAGFGVYYLCRHADVAAALKQPRLFSSAGMKALSDGQTGLMGSQDEADHQSLDAESLLTLDPPDHDRLRDVVNRGFTPRRVSDLEPRIRAIAETLVDEIVARGGQMDLMADLAVPLPVQVIAGLLGVDPARGADFKRWADTSVQASTGTGGIDDPEAVRTAQRELREYLTAIVAERRANPQDDLISTIIEGGEAGDGLSDPQAIAFSMLLLLAGIETTTNLLGNAMRALLAHPDQLREVVAEPARIPAALEETLRWDGPVQGVFRTPSEDVEVAGTTIPKGRFVLLHTGSANRDEAAFPKADRFDIHRNTSGHLGFGYGVHFCLGASLARLEARVTLETLLSRCQDLELAATSVEVIDSMLVRGPRSLPLSFRPVA